MVKVFISWSGDLSHKLAEGFHRWLPGALQAVQPYFTPADVEKGARWNTEIAKELESSDVGVLFVTRDNIGSAWLLYESGALAKSLEKSRVCPLIFNLTPSDLPGPLRQFQATEFKEVDFRRLLRTINSAQGEHKLADTVLNEVFEMWWPRLYEKFKDILNEEMKEETTPIRSDREILEEILELSRSNYKRSMTGGIAFGAVRELTQSLKSAVDAIQGDMGPQTALETLSSMRPVLEYLLRRAHANRPEMSEELAGELSALQFEYQSSDLDEEIPF
jgi:hypothetical protein